MSELWFPQALGGVSRRGTMLYASGPDGVWVVHEQELVHPSDPAQEAAELLGQYGALVHGVGDLLLTAGVPLPGPLAEWATAPDVPMAQLGGWAPGLVLADGVSHLAHVRAFDDTCAFASTWGGRHILVLTPSSESVPVLVTRDVPAPPPGWDQHGS